MSFEICFEVFRPLEDDPFVARGHITLGQSIEPFRATIGYWKQNAYRRHWFSELERIVAGEEKGYLITDLPHPKANSVSLWAMWRFNNEVIFHEQLVMPSLSKIVFNPDERWQIGEYGNLSDDGTKISEWRITTLDIKAFLENNRAI